MDSWWVVAAFVLLGTLMVFGAIAAAVLLDSSWPLTLLILASLIYLLVFVVRDIRSGKTEPVTPAQQRSHRLFIWLVVVVAVLVIWLAR